jgi:hypothetical protein
MALIYFKHATVAISRKAPGILFNRVTFTGAEKLSVYCNILNAKGTFPRSSLVFTVFEAFEGVPVSTDMVTVSFFQECAT